ncbi:mannan endo-1,4-beta-mannosidase [Pseudozyma hubeiensis SY62]|uniref:mannan endo-1,4-beta-mannosidase n=1 Tax=Pseudozyma hubeiensis (strain SY62) TaxID=1305764 RepID=R9P4V8_PSEHS|nr:mannan endo-1,4-beta-mannosidase [Pseudozyma hubeiensis SY62]GAC96376.1 mannan endo-1,4-beta-mannosidase [Pseudozyma hubeiensis SY62]
MALSLVATTARAGPASIRYDSTLLPRVASPVAADDFIHVDKLRLRDSSKRNYYLTGFNYWACMNLAADSDAGGDYNRFIRELDQMAAVGVNHLRIMAGSEGAPTQQPFRMNPPLQPSPGVYNEKILKGLDRCLAEMAQRGMRATMTLNDQWQWSGGFAQYVSWANGNETYAYPPSWNFTAPPQRKGPPGRGWGNYTTTGSFNDYVDYGNRIYTDAKAEAMFKRHINKVINRRNTVNGRLYKEDATIMTWQLANEPQPANQENLLGPYKLQYAPNPSDPLLPWIDRISTYIRSLAPHQLISTGFEGKQGEWYWKAVHRPKNIDYGTIHVWVQNWGVYDMLNSSRANLRQAEEFAAAFMANASRWAGDIGKPVFLEEFGMARDNWKNNVTAGEYQYATKATTHSKDEYFSHIIGLAVESFKSSRGGFVGTSPWSYGGTYRPETQQANEFGMWWAGDPPHEAPGWYDVYDKDYALQIVKKQKETVDKFVNGSGGR